MECSISPSLHLSIFFDDENDRPSLSLIPASLVVLVHHRLSQAALHAEEELEVVEAEVLGEAGLAEDIAAEHLLLLMDGAGFIKGL